MRSDEDLLCCKSYGRAPWTNHQVLLSTAKSLGRDGGQQVWGYLCRRFSKKTAVAAIILHTQAMERSHVADGACQIRVSVVSANTDVLVHHGRVLRLVADHVGVSE